MIRQYLLILFSLSFVIVVVGYIPDTSWIYKLLSVLNAAIATLFLFTDRERPYSLHKIVNLFILFFFVIANAIQFSTKTNVTTFPMLVSAEDTIQYERFQLLTLLILILYNTAYPLFRKNKDFVHVTMESPSWKRLLLIALFSLACTLFYYRNALPLMFFRGVLDFDGDIEVQDLGGGQAGFLLFDKIIRALSFACCFWAIHCKLPRKIQWSLLLIMLLTLFPLSLARNATAMYWLPIVLLMFKVLKRENIFVLVMLIGLLVVFPFLENFRHWNGELSSMSYSLDFMNEMHFDASQNFMIVLKQEVVTWGRQLLGVFLFWMPRSLWEAKPIGSGHFMAEQYSDFTNISMPFFAEGYLNFGFIGMILFTIILAWFCAYFDDRFWNHHQELSLFAPYYMLLVSSLLFILRGDLMSSTSYTLATLFDFYIVYKIATFHRKTISE